MAFKNVFGIYQAIQQILEKSDKALTCVDLWDDPEVRKYAPTSDRVSDYLGHMYRRQILTREPAPISQNSSARYAYRWKKKPANPVPTARAVQPRLHVGDSGKPTIQYDEKELTTTIELPDFVLVIKKR